MTLNKMDVKMLLPLCDLQLWPHTWHWHWILGYSVLWYIWPWPMNFQFFSGIALDITLVHSKNILSSWGGDKRSWDNIKNVDVSFCLGILVICFCLLFFSANFRRQEFYTKTLELMEGYPAAADILGKPIRIRKIDLGDRRLNYTDGINARVILQLPSNP